MKKLNTYCLLLLSVLAVSLQCAGAAPANTSDADTTGANLKILTWNIYMLPKIVPRPGKRDRARAIVEELKKSDFDIIVFEEAFLPAARKIISAGLDSLYPYRYGPVNNWKGTMLTNSGVWVISKVKMDIVNTVRFNESAGYDRYARKGAALLQGVWNGKRFQLLGTHLQADEAVNYQDIRNHQMDQIYMELLAPYKIDSVPQIICGDMNTEVEMKNYYCSMLDCLDATNGAIDGLQQSSYDGLTNDIAEYVGGKRKTTLDYILLRNNGIKIKSIHRSISVLKKGKQQLSDHYGVVCELKF